jgi:hypothetical protein
MMAVYCGDYARVLFNFARQAAGAAVRPAFPAPSAVEGRRPARLGRHARREIADVYLKLAV